MIKQITKIINNYNLTFDDKPIYVNEVAMSDYIPDDYCKEIVLSVSNAGSLPVQDMLSEPSKIQNFLIRVQCKTNSNLLYSDNEAFLNSLIRELITYTDRHIIQIRQVGSVRHFETTPKGEEILGYDLQVKVFDYFLFTK